MLTILVLFLMILYILPTYPKPRIFENFITEAERRHIMQEAIGKLEQSSISHNKRVDESIRKSETAWLSREDPVVRAITKRCFEVYR